MIFANLELANGDEIRFGPDEADAGDIPISTQSGTEADWGYAESSVVLKRPDDLTALDGHLFKGVTQTDEDGEVISQGRILGLPRVGVNEIEIDCEGPLAALDDNETIREVYRDIDLSRWTDSPSTERQLALLPQSGIYFRLDQGSVEVQPDSTGRPAVRLALSRLVYSATARPQVETWYDSGGVAIGSVYYAYDDSNGAGGKLTGGAPGWGVYLQLSDDDKGTTREFTAELSGAASTGTLSATGVAKKFAFLMMNYGDSAGSPIDGEWTAWFRNLAVYGTHGLTKRGTEPAAGFYASDIVRHALSLGGPGLPIAPDGIEESAFIIPHLPFREDGTARRIIDAASVFGAAGSVPPDYGCYEDGFFWRSPGSYGREWHVRLSEGIEANNDGPSGEERCNGFKVIYTDGAGTSHSVGPPGSNSDYETVDLLDSDPANPVNAAGLAARFRSRTVGITSQAGAVLIGQLLMAEANDTTRTGSTTIRGKVFDAAGNEYMPRLMRFGDSLVVEDDEGDTTAHRIRSTSRQDETVTVTVGPKPRRSETLLARLAAAITPLGHF